jgi:hypothetical protein
MINKPKIAFALSIFFIFFLVYYEIGSYMLCQKHYINKMLLFFSEKAMLATGGYPPRLENIGFVYPPLIFIFFLIFKNPILVVSFLSSALATIILFVTKNVKTVLLFLSAVGLYVSLEDPLYLLLYFILVSVSYFLFLYKEKAISLYIFAAGLIFGFSFYVDFTSITLIPLILYAIYTQEKIVEKEKLISIYIVTITPIFFFAISWLYLNWVFMKDPFYFINSPYSIFHPKSVEAILAKKNIVVSLKLLIAKTLYILPLSLPYFLSLINYIKNKLTFYTAPLYLIYISPIVLMFFDIYFGMYSKRFSDAFGLLFFYVVFEHIISHKKNLILNLSFYLSIILSFVIMPFSSSYNESTFSRALLGMHIKPNTVYYEEAANFLKHKKGKILADDVDDYPVIYFVGNAKRFILPYQYEFYTVLSSPYNFVDYILVDTSSTKDKVLNFYKSQIPGFRLVYENKMFKIYEKENLY